MRLEIQIDEALKPSQFRPLVKRWDPKTWEKMFEGKYRVYLELEATEEVDVTPDPVVERALAVSGYEIVNYKAGLCKKKGDEKGLIKIGKVLSNIDTGPEWRGDYILSKFQSDPNRQASRQKDLMVVISRHPYDVAGMSTDRGWTSCMNLDTGAEKDYIPSEIEAGAATAYLIKKSDPNINKPVARIAIRVYFKGSHPLWSDKAKKILVACSKTYGSSPSTFRKTVENWLDKKQSSMSGIFVMHPDAYAESGDPTKIVKMKGGKDKVLKTFKDFIALRNLDTIFESMVDENNFPQFRNEFWSRLGITIPDCREFWNTATVKDFKLLLKKISHLSYEYAIFKIVIAILKKLKPGDIEFEELLARMQIMRSRQYQNVKFMFGNKVWSKDADPRKLAEVVLALDASEEVMKLLTFRNNEKLKTKIYDSIIKDFRSNKDLV